MDYEKKYNEALERAKKWYYAPNADKIPTYANKIISQIFPELKESEDEKIRKDIAETIKIEAKELSSVIASKAELWLAWLEKQGEQKPIEAKPKFKFGDWITFYGSEPFKILKVESEQNGILDYLLLEPSGHSTYYDKKYVDENARLWTIQDAKDGDILASNGNIILFKEISNSARKDYKYIKSHCLVLAHSTDFYTGGSYNLDDRFHPATKEQRDLLFQGMKEADYEWDNEKKELNKIEKKPVWSEENVEPKFSVGDWITNGKLLVGQVTSFDGEYYHYVCNGVQQPLHISNTNKWHLWTIKDAKDGDVLVFDDIIMIFKNIKTDCTANTYILYCDEIVAVDEWCDFGHNARPATKEQRDFLFQKIKESGYKWDVKKKKLKKIQKKSVQSKEDEVDINDAMWKIEQAMSNLWHAERWLKSLKEKIK